MSQQFCSRDVAARAAVCLLLLCAGCGRSNRPERAAASGRVTLDGQNIERGSIAFFSVGDQAGLAAGGPIVDGRYAIERERGPVVGRNRIEIKSGYTTGRKVPAPFGDPGQTTDERAESIPAQYNAQSTLERDVQPAANQLDFELSAQ